jgi:hypothetical protein
MDQPRKSSRFRYPSVVEVAEALAQAPHYLPWRNEASVRHRIKVLLILQGMHSWQRVDFIAHGSVGRARIENGIRQPPGYDSDNELAEWIWDSECPICERPYKRYITDQVYCSTACSRRAAEIEYGARPGSVLSDRHAASGAANPWRSITPGAVLQLDLSWSCRGTGHDGDQVDGGDPLLDLPHCVRARDAQ